MITNLNAYPVAGSPQDLNSFKVIYKLLKEEKKVVIFPEGYRTFDGSFGEIKTGVAMLAIKANCPVIPVYIHGAYEAWPRQKKFFNLFGHTACVFGHPLYPSNTTSNSKKQDQEILTRRLKESLDKLKTWYLSGAPGFPPS
ncbi:hypothetical protein PHSC3_001843 [Chlamydiales bacterium STE3]|nr:hypothetical protein PHSC3_001843 [Chlamydiales bacterium STE3]